ncbi:MAG: DMT family transporter [Opitutales bacterium]
MADSDRGVKADKALFMEGLVLVFIAAALFGFHTTFVKLAYEMGSNVHQVLFYEFFLGSIILLFFARKQLSLMRGLRRREWIRLSLWAVFGAGGTAVCLYRSIQLIPVALSIVLLFQYLFWVFLLDFLCDRKKPAPRQVCALVLILIGTIAATRVWAIDWGVLRLEGIAFGVASGITYGSFLFFAKGMGTIGTPVVRSLSVCALIAGLTGLTGLLRPEAVFLLSTASPERLFLLLIALALMGQVIPMFSFSKGIPLVGGPVAGVVASIELPIAAVASFLFLGEALMPLQWLGVALITVAVVLANLK